jgi:DnaJ-class molecular chaperone
MKKTKKCKECEGAGFVIVDWHPSGAMPTYRCPKCNGTGKVKRIAKK